MMGLDEGVSEERARELLGQAVYDYVAGGAGDERTLAANVDAWGRWRLRPRVLSGQSSASTTTALLGAELSLPVLIAPIGLQRLLHPDGELASSAGAALAGAGFCLSSMATVAPEDLAADARHWFQLYPLVDEGRTFELVDRAEAAGYGALMVTVDLPLVGMRDRDRRNGFSASGCAIPLLEWLGARAETGGVPGSQQRLFSALDWKGLERLCAHTRLPVIVKGLLAAEDARRAAFSGAAAVVCSNHGGRQLDGVLPTAEALPEIVQAVDVPVLVDGGLRRGSDVVKALALGARAVLIGRPLMWSLAAGGVAAVADHLQRLQREIETALILLGCGSVAAPGPEHVLWERA